MKTLENREIAKLIVIAAVLFGGWLRFSPALQAGFPINDGGMFYSMIEDLHANNFLLPRYTSYNLSDVPYAYPPLGFYIGALLKFFGIDTLHTLMYLPPALSVLVILAFFGLARQIFNGSPLHAALATLVLALIPNSYTWFVMGGGLTRSLGHLFLLLFLTFLLKLYENPQSNLLWRSGILGGLAILSHPEVSVHALTAGVVFWLFRSRTRQGMCNSILVALIALAISSVWWATNLWQHGPAPFLNALQTGQQSQIFRGLLILINFRFTEESMAPLVAMIGLLGLVYCLARKEYFLPTWLMIHFISQPRSAGAVAIYPLAMLTAIALVEVILPAIVYHPDKQTYPVAKTLQNKKTVVIIALLAIYLILAGSIYNRGFSLYHLSQQERKAMSWIQAETPLDAKFVVLKITDNPMLDHSAEWFPALAKRQSPFTLQGQEWIRGAQFSQTRDAYGQTIQCLLQDIACLEKYLAQYQTRVDYIYIAKQPVGSASGTNGPYLRLTESLKESLEYRLIYENEGAVVFMKE